MSVQDAGRSMGFFAKLREEFRRVLFIFLYLWALFALFQVHRWMVAEDQDIVQGQILAFVNAYVFAKVMFILEWSGLTEVFPQRPLMVPVLFKSAVFAVALVAFYFVEEVGIGLVRGNSLAESMPYLFRHGPERALGLAFIMFVVLIPFFCFRELSRVVGPNVLRCFFFQSEGAERARHAVDVARKSGTAP